MTNDNELDPIVTSLAQAGFTANVEQSMENEAVMAAVVRNDTLARYVEIIAEEDGYRVAGYLDDDDFIDETELARNVALEGLPVAIREWLDGSDDRTILAHINIKAPWALIRNMCEQDGEISEVELIDLVRCLINSSQESWTDHVALAEVID